MSTAAPVPETHDLRGDDARATLRRTGRARLLADAFRRLRAADGFSHARSLAFLLALALIQAVVAVVGVAALVGDGGVSRSVVRMLEAAVPGPAGEKLTGAVRQARHAARGGDVVAIALGSIGALVTLTTAFGQTERALNRLYGIERDRPTAHKYGLALGLAVTAGLTGAAAMVVIAFGRAIGDESTDGWIADVWGVARWPLGLALAMAATALVFQRSPRRRQPAFSWLAYGATISVLLWMAVTAGLGGALSLSSSFGDTYGPLAGFVALLMWGFLSATATLFGAAVAAQLEAVRAQRPGPVGERDRATDVDADAQPPPGPRAGSESAVLVGR